MSSYGTGFSGSHCGSRLMAVPASRRNSNGKAGPRTTSGSAALCAKTICCACGSAGFRRRDHEIGLTDFPKLAKYLFKKAGIRPAKDIKIEDNQVPHAEDFHSIIVPGAAFVIACRPLDRRP